MKDIQNEREKGERRGWQDKKEGMMLGDMETITYICRENCMMQEQLFHINHLNRRTV
ncbi:MAG: hypothetical protein K2H04_00425 [Bacteroidaceae bacterium]|nr:hypothetical protein [Bacteroidaceae bacterium]MDE5740253.1 hypothetical protein [Bacteroidaceae bacterium]MDE5998536.1 hypothetical protein [Bacteroidaceae bacterium]